MDVSLLCVLKLLCVTPLVRRTGSQTTSSRRAASVLRRSVLYSDFITVERVARASVHLALHSRGPSRLEAGITQCVSARPAIISLMTDVSALHACQGQLGLTFSKLLRTILGRLGQSLTISGKTLTRHNFTLLTYSQLNNNLR